MFQFASCSSISPVTPFASVFWDESPSGNIQTNDFERLQNRLSFNVILPEYFPEELKSDHPKCVVYRNPENQEVNLYIFYYSINPRELVIREDYPVEAVSENNVATALLDYRPIKLKDIQVLEQLRLAHSLPYFN
jgi:hypothetical protein